MGISLFFSALLVYSLFSSPTPDAFGAPELLVALGLLLSIRMEKGERHFPLLILFMVGLVMPLVVGSIAGYPPVDILRDIIPYLFLFMPLFWGWTARSSPEREFIIPLVAVMGVLFSFRTVYAYRDILLTPERWGLGAPADLLYLANSPEVLLAALFCGGVGFYQMIAEQRFIRGAGLVFLSFVPTLAMTLMLQRAGLGMLVLNGFFGLLVLSYFRPWQAVGVWGGLAVVGIFLYPVLVAVAGHLAQKTELVGMNSRLQEWDAVFHVLSRDKVTLLFGVGWGGRIENPAVGGLSVTYTHSFLSALLLKTGVLGAVVIVIGCLSPVFQAIRRLLSQRDTYQVLLFCVVLSPFLVSALLYASYKSLGFGLILLAFSVLGTRKLETN